MGNKPNLDDYVEVSQRIVHFREQYPDGTLQAEIVQLTDSLVVVKAYAYRTPEDERPGTGLASEPIPGRTPYTKDSELMNAETSAWGRAIIAVGASDAKRVASANEVRNRAEVPDHGELMERVGLLVVQCRKAGLEGNFDATVEWSAQTPQNAQAAIARLEKLLAGTR